MESAELIPKEKTSKQKKRVMSACQTTKLLKTWKLNDRQKQLVNASGLSNLVHTAGFDIDHLVLTAFYELWSKETNTARFHGFEMAPSLRDTAYILGVPVIGRVVTTGAVVNKSAGQLCFQYLGRMPGCKDCRDGYVRLSWLYSKFSQLSKYPTDDEIMYSTRAYLLYLIGSTLLPERDMSCVPPKYLALLSDFGKIREYAWGAAALAHLYRSLSRDMTSSSKKRLFGGATLLMGWIYEYIPAIRPEMEDAPSSSFPSACRWMGSRVSQLTNKVSEIRKTFSLLQVSDVNWEPYKDLDPAVIPKNCIAADDVCFSRTWLISFNLKEIYVPDRYARQFGQEQHPLNDVPLRERRHWSASVDWSLEYASEIEQFQQLINASHCDHATISATSSKAEHFAPATIMQGALGPKLMNMAENIKKELPVIERFLARQPLPDEVVRSLARIHDLVEASHPTQCDATSGAQRGCFSQPKFVAPNPPMIATCEKTPAGNVCDVGTAEVLDTVTGATAQDGNMTTNSVTECSDLPKSKKPKRHARKEAQGRSENGKTPADNVHDLGTAQVLDTVPGETAQDGNMTTNYVTGCSDLPKSKKLKRPARYEAQERSDKGKEEHCLNARSRKNRKQLRFVGEGGNLRRSSRLCVQIKRFKHLKGKGSDSSDPILL